MADEVAGGSPELRAAVGKVAHHVPGRLRIRFDRDVNVDEVAQRIRAATGDKPGIHSVEARSTSNSVVVRYDAAVADIGKLMTEEGFPEAAVDVLDAGLAEVAHVASSTPTGRRVVRAVGEANTKLVKASSGLLDLRDVLPLTLFGLGIGRLVTGGLEPVPWSTLLYYSFSTFTILQGHRTEHHDAAAVAEVNAIEIARQRLARGEITRSEYRLIRAELESDGGEVKAVDLSIGDEGQTTPD